MKVENINIQEAIDLAKETLENDKTLSSSVKAIVKLLIVIISILVQKLNLNSSNSSKPPSQDPNRIKKKRHKQYEFILTVDLKERPLEVNKLYLQVENNAITYQCLDKDNSVVRGTICLTDLPKGITIPKVNGLSELLKIRKEILQITCDRGDTQPLKKPGGQPGRKGNTLTQVEDPDEVEDILIDRASLPDGRNYKNNGYTAKQVVNINISRHIIEYRAEILIDDFGNEYEAEFPNNITRPIQYGSSVKAKVTFSSVYQLIPYKRLQEQLANEYNIPISTGSIYNFNKEASNKLLQLGFASVAKKELANSKVAHADETSINVNGHKIWLHDLSNAKWTWLEPHNNRGIVAMNNIGIIPEFTGTLCHDHWKSYFTYKKCKHALCNAHHLRELRWSYEQNNQQWAKEMYVFLNSVNKEVDDTGKGCLSKSRISVRIKEYREIIAKGEIECPAVEPAPGKKRKPKQGKSRNLLVRFRDYEDNVLLFMKDPLVPFTNNQGERDLRMIKVHQKISGCFKTIETSTQYCIIRSYLSTCKKNYITATEALKLLFDDELPKFIQDKINSRKIS